MALLEALHFQWILESAYQHLQNISLSTSTKIKICWEFDWDWLPWWIRQQRIYLQCGRPGFDPWVWKIPWRRIGQPTTVFLPGESPWTEEPGRLQFMGLQRVVHDWMTRHIAQYWIYKSIEANWHLNNTKSFNHNKWCTSI